MDQDDLRIRAAEPAAAATPAVCRIAFTVMLVGLHLSAMAQSVSSPSGEKEPVGHALTRVELDACLHGRSLSIDDAVNIAMAASPSLGTVLSMLNRARARSVESTPACCPN